MNIEHTHWHPVAALSDVGTQPLAVTLLGEDLVLWRDSDQVLHAWLDRCPHRGARLSMGRVVGQRLECPYHGWQFDGQGRCRVVPAQPGFTPPASQGLRPLAVQQALGLCWVRLQGAVEADGHPVPHAPPIEGLRQVLCGPYDVATSAPRIVENFLDMAHFGFVHEGWLGDRELTEVPAYEVTDTLQGVLATGCKAWQPRSNLHSLAPAQVEYRYEVTAPYTAWLTKVPEPGSTRVADWRESIGLMICPQTPETSRVWFLLAVADHETPDQALQDFQHTIFTQDQPVLESQRPRCLPLDLRAEQHTVADRMSSAYRRYLQRSGITFGVC